MSNVSHVAWALRKPSTMDALHAHGVKVIGEASAWRHREFATFTIDAMANAVYAPDAPIGPDVTALRSFVEKVLRAQCSKNPSVAGLTSNLGRRDRVLAGSGAPTNPLTPIEESIRSTTRTPATPPSRLRPRSRVAGIAVAAFSAAAAYGITATGLDLTPRPDPEYEAADGASFAFGDGSVRFVRDSISLNLYRALATTSGGEVVTD